MNKKEVSTSVDLCYSSDGEKEISNSSNGSDEPIFIADPLADPFMEGRAHHVLLIVLVLVLY